MKWFVIVILGCGGMWLGPQVLGQDLTNAPVLEGSASSGMAPASSDPNGSLPVVTVNGIDVMRGNPEVAFKVEDAAGIRSYVLNRGEEREGIRIEAIDQGRETVTVNNHGRIQKLGLERAATPVPIPSAPSVAATPAVTTAPPVPEAVYPVRQSQPTIGPGVSVVVIGHRDPPPHINGLGPMDVTPGGGVGGGGGFAAPTNTTNMIRMPNTNASVRFTQPGQLGPAGPRATIPASSARIPPPPPAPSSSGSSPDVGGSATKGVQGPPPSTQPPPMPPSPSQPSR